MGKLNGSHLRERRKKDKLTIKELAKLIGVSRTFLGDIENGRRGVPEGGPVERYCLSGYGLRDNRICEAVGSLSRVVEQ